ncbi:hypothetical protein AB5I41_14040 [Sphingomonas sp. MMS24-JH45]
MEYRGRDGWATRTPRGRDGETTRLRSRRDGDATRTPRRGERRGWRSGDAAVGMGA